MRITTEGDGELLNTEQRRFPSNQPGAPIVEAV